jgi:hypothetical protein
MSLVILLVIALYVAALIVATVLGYRYGRKRGWSQRKRWMSAGIGFLIVFLPVFWDWLPTVWLHAYYCDKYSGLTVYQTPDQWNTENPGVAETLARQTPPLQVGSWPKFYVQLNQRFRWEIESTERLLWLRQSEDRLVDAKTGRVLVRVADISTGQSGRTFQSFRDYKFWLYRESCQPQGLNENRKRFSELTIAFENLGGR